MPFERHCDICEHDLTHAPIYGQRQMWQYVRCPHCAMVSLNRMPTGDELKSYYNEAYQVPLRYHSSGVSREARFMLRVIREHHPGCGKLLEVGCSYGFFLDAARRDGWEVCGVDLDEAAARQAREKLGIEVFSGTLESEYSRLR